MELIIRPQGVGNYLVQSTHAPSLEDTTPSPPFRLSTRTTQPPPPPPCARRDPRRTAATRATGEWHGGALALAAAYVAQTEM
ncbi:hypothetical protein A0H81_08837 [Grifola frondosa]|uniref:Uncharacterized protein n=1 Tax=Grifola frondosa TaxID=5627 RepID=A0A1C7M411_GRIFR|nr:hypothetical protein A0H81_08837 [Grifola frondosa]